MKEVFLVWRALVFKSWLTDRVRSLSHRLGQVKPTQWALDIRWEAARRELFPK
jgi:hypothetical protein